MQASTLGEVLSAPRDEPPTPAVDAGRLEVVRGKVPKRCLWDACKALTLGMSLFIIGTGVAVMGYFSDHPVTAPDTSGDWNVTNRNETTTIHPNNLSYVGPIIMGFGGFIIVIACVMTFEARDSAARVAPSKLKASQDASHTEENIETLEKTIRTFQRVESRRGMKVQISANMAKKKSKPSEIGAERPSASPRKKPFSGALTQLSRSLADRFSYPHRWRRGLNDANLNKSPSAPDLWEAIPDALLDELLATGRGGMPPPDRKHGDPSRPLATVPSSMLPRFTRLKLETLSMDNPFSDICEFYTPMCFEPMQQHNKNIYEFVTPLSMKSSRRLSKGITNLDALSRKPSQGLGRGITEFNTPLAFKPTPRLRKGFSESSAPLAIKYSQQHVDDICEFESLPVELPRQQIKDSDSDPDDSGSQASMALDLHECQVTIKVKDETASKRSETARRHQLQRQKPVEEESPSALPKYPGFAKVVLPPTAGKIDVGTMMSPNLRSPCHHCCSEPGKIRTSKPKRDFRSQSFSKATTYADTFEDEGTSKIFCIDDYRGPPNYYSDYNIRSFEKGKPRSMQRSSSSVTPLRLSRRQSSKSLSSKDPRKHAGNKTAAKLKGSLSAEEQPTPRIRLASRRRSLSFSPTGHASALRDETPANAREFL